MAAVMGCGVFCQRKLYSYSNLDKRSFPFILINMIKLCKLSEYYILKWFTLILISSHMEINYLTQIT